MPISKTMRAGVVVSGVWIVAVASYGYQNHPTSISMAWEYNTCISANNDTNVQSSIVSDVAKMMQRHAPKQEFDALLTSWGYGNQLHVLKPEAYTRDAEALLTSLRWATIHDCNRISDEYIYQTKRDFWTDIAIKTLLGLAVGWAVLLLGGLGLRWIMRGS